MENASKALIIAGAILISILLISLGILIYNQASSITNSSSMDEAEIQAFNQKFTQFEGKQNGAQIKSMVQQVLASNANEDNEDRPISVSLGSSWLIGDASSTTVTDDHKKYDANTYKSIKTNTRYNVQVNLSTSGNNAGLVYQIVVTAAS